MPNLTRESRRERIAEDDGDPEDTVRVRVTRTCGTPIYHTTEEQCQHVDGQEVETEPVERGWCWKRNYAPCKRCILDDVDESGVTGSPALTIGDEDFEPDYEFEWDERQADGGGEA
ncbi:hypothetical protein [Haloarcula pelagica]|uniref:hypothetical protein n=1 Tax=Haloarcula pelagica TaxID=3033389 RepID=UPI0024C22CF3|nr:hypothetical protein [Halomicroarcula sp. YJ-61-S]